MQTAFGIRSLSRSELKKLILRKEIFVQSKHNVALLQGTMPTSPSAGSLSLLVTKDTDSHLLTKQEVSTMSAELYAGQKRVIHLYSNFFVRT